jgi:hypothetical protein
MNAPEKTDPRKSKKASHGKHSNEANTAGPNTMENVLVASKKDV